MIYTLLFVGIGLFIAGFYTGLWVQRHSYTDREVAKIVEVPKVVEIEKPVVIQVPKHTPSRGGLAVMGQNRNAIPTSAESEEVRNMQALLEQLPE